ncbi:MAG: hypothetical protein IPN29_20060 [Saprospiraceae bacterium]|nr:hypothetical protein [Saprospiraceae bacterium]
MYRSSFYQWVYPLLALVVLSLGVLLYIIGRGHSSPIFQLFSISEVIYNAPIFNRLKDLLQSHEVINHSLPDGLWMFAAMTIQLWIWDRTFTRKSCIWMAIVYVVCLSNEVLQFSGITRGTFDANDLAFMMLGGLLPIIIEFLIQNIMKWKNTKLQY